MTALKQEQLFDEIDVLPIDYWEECKTNHGLEFANEVY